MFQIRNGKNKTTNGNNTSPTPVANKMTMCISPSQTVPLEAAGPDALTKGTRFFVLFAQSSRLFSCNPVFQRRRGISRPIPAGLAERHDDQAT
jgi:hypothetical protein